MDLVNIWELLDMWDLLFGEVDINKVINKAVKITKDSKVVKIKCPTCWKIIWKYSYNFLKKKQILLCKNCNDETKVDISFNIKR
jgi:predicted RNA-binding Zn-ribbon protein involved in translation (DUF1610 family)